jgi:hypothetical protein
MLAYTTSNTTRIAVLTMLTAELTSISKAIDH